MVELGASLGKGLYFSLKMMWCYPIKIMFRYGSVTALTVAKLLNDMTLDVKLKWPNDLIMPIKNWVVLVELEGVDKQTLTIFWVWESIQQRLR